MELNRIKAILNEKGVKQTWLAEKLGKSFSMVNAYSCNRRQPTLEVLNRIADILQVNVKELLVDNNKQNNNGN
ncbi:transcriptional regulator [Bacteroidia bacterium]|nr:transcriptional regulator [Bacteroidia bacterium]